MKFIVLALAGMVFAATPMVANAGPGQGEVWIASKSAAN